MSIITLLSNAVNSVFPPFSENQHKYRMLLSTCNHGDHLSASYPFHYQTTSKNNMKMVLMTSQSQEEPAEQFQATLGIKCRKKEKDI